GRQSAASAAALVILALGWAGFGWVRWIFPSAHLVLILLPAGWLAGFAARLFRGLSLCDSASFADRAGSLKERAATALESADKSSPPTGIPALQLKDAETHLEGLPAAKLKYSRTLGPGAKLTAACALIIAALAFIPRPEYRPAAKSAPLEAAKKIDIATRNLQNIAQKTKDIKRDIQRARDLAKRVKAGAVEPAEAAQQVREIADALKRLAADADAARNVEAKIARATRDGPVNRRRGF
ncbi:unnamed protein product, partial [marine sediment metagenome]